jgi:DNA-binding transcriptional MerR regulator
MHVRFLKTSEAAGLLHVSPNTLRAWERRFGFPKPQRSPGKHRMYVHGEVVALRDALQDGLSISSAISRAREGLSADTDSLQSALVSFDRERADAAIEASITLRSVDRAIDETLLPTLDEIFRRQGAESAAWAFSARWASDWLRRASRLASPPARPVGVVLGDAARDELDPDFPHIRALELYCLRAGFRVLGLSARGVVGLGDAVASHRPDIVILAGGYLSDDAVARWAYAVRFSAGPLPVSVFRRGGPPSRQQGTATNQLPASASAAMRTLLELSEQAGQRPATNARRVVGL